MPFSFGSFSVAGRRAFVRTSLVSLMACIVPVASAHVTLETRSAPAASPYKAVFLLGHGCDGSSTTAFAVQIPAGFSGAKPYMKPGWRVATSARLQQPNESHGKRVTENVSLVNWTAISQDAVVPDAFHEEFVLRGALPETAGPLWFKVLQTCENGIKAWHDIPATGSSTKGLKLPAVLLEVTPAEALHHQH